MNCDIEKWVLIQNRYNGPPRVIRLLLENGKAGLFRGVASVEGYTRYIFCFLEFWPLIEGASGEREQT